MQNAFMIIITLLGAAYAIFYKEAKTALGFLVITVALALQIQGIAEGFWSDILVALSLIIFALGTFIVVSKKKIEVKKELEDKNEE